MLDRFLKKITKFFKEITKFFKEIAKFFKEIAKCFKEIAKFFKEITKFFKRISKFFKRITIYSKEFNPKHFWKYKAIMTVDLINVVLFLKRYTLFLLFHYYLLQLLKRYTKFLLFWKMYSFFIVLPSFSKKNLYYYYSKDVHNVPTISHMHIQKDNFYQRVVHFYAGFSAAPFQNSGGLKQQFKLWKKHTPPPIKNEKLLSFVPL